MSEDTVTYITDADAPEAEQAPEAIDELSLYGVAEQAGGESPAQWQPRTEEQVDWVLEKIADARAKVERVRTNADAQIRAAEGRIAFFEGRYGAALEDYARARLAGGRSRTVTLLNGRLSFTAVKARIAVERDDDRLAAWARENAPDLVQTREVVTVSRTDLAKRLEIRTTSETDEESGEVVERHAVVVAGTGEEAPVATVTPAGERFQIR